MSRAASAIPEERALLCEGCGYILTGLPADSRCPECAKPISESHPSLRRIPCWEKGGDDSDWSLFWSTSFAVLFHPPRFFRTLATRVETSRSASFARRHYVLASTLFSLAATLHLFWLTGSQPPELALAVALAIFFIACYGFLRGTIEVAARLTAWEAGYRGLRLPLGVVRRGLDYHSAHYLPVALMAFATVGGYQLLLARDIITDLSATRYIYVLCAEVVLGAAYLFVTYWKGMRNMLFANG